MGLNTDALVALETALEVHSMLFGDLYKEAGIVRRTAVTAGVSMPADPSRIKTEWELLRMQLPEILGTTATIDSLLTSAAFFHIRGKCIQPVNDGNKRTTRLQASCWLAQAFGSLPHWSFETTPHEDYYSALQVAQKTHDLAPMVNILRKNYQLVLLTSPLPSPFRIRPYLIDARTGVSQQTSAADLFPRSQAEGGLRCL